MLQTKLKRKVVVHSLVTTHHQGRGQTIPRNLCFNEWSPLSTAAVCHTLKTHLTRSLTGHIQTCYVSSFIRFTSLIAKSKALTTSKLMSRIVYGYPPIIIISVESSSCQNPTQLPPEITGMKLFLPGLVFNWLTVSVLAQQQQQTTAGVCVVLSPHWSTDSHICEKIFTLSCLGWMDMGLGDT